MSNVKVTNLNFPKLVQYSRDLQAVYTIRIWSWQRLTHLYLYKTGPLTPGLYTWYSFEPDTYEFSRVFKTTQEALDALAAYQEQYKKTMIEREKSTSYSRVMRRVRI